MKDILVSLYNFHLKINEMEDDLNNDGTSRHQQNVNFSNDNMPKTLATFKKILRGGRYCWEYIGDWEVFD